MARVGVGEGWQKSGSRERWQGSRRRVAGEWE